jgi:hypothetical protein
MHVITCFALEDWPDGLTVVDRLAHRARSPRLPHLVVGAGQDVPAESAAVSAADDLELARYIGSRASSKSASDIFRLPPCSHRVANEDAAGLGGVSSPAEPTPTRELYHLWLCGQV